jgi:hypothetical protein
LGWIGSGARYTAVSNPFVSRVTLANLAAPAPGGTRHLIRLPRFVTAPDEYYTIEKRCFTGYDAILPAETVIMHAVDPALGTCQAQVVDPDFDGDPNDASAQWEPGETFTDTANKLVVTIESEGASSASVVFSNAGRSTTYVDSAAGSTQDGSSTYPWNTAFEGSGAVYPSGTVYIKPGTYGETMEFVKPMLLRGWGAGNVVIGE